MSKLGLIFEKQLMHLCLLIVLLIGVHFSSRIDGFFDGELWGISTATWFYLSIAVPIAHQVFVWFCWRVEMHASLLTRWFGSGAFTVYAVFFAVLIIARPITMTLLAIANRDTLPLIPWIAWSLSAVLAVPTIYLFHSIKRYFGFLRAFGIDHFDIAYRSRPLVKDGIFRFSGNSMYTFGALVLWIPAILFCSKAAVFSTLFSHLYIWVHYWCVEKPDIRRIYGQP
jgi:hypothetical protein